MKPMEIVRTRRKTLGIRIRPDGSVEVRAPLGMPEEEIRRLLKRSEDWIREHSEKAAKAFASRPQAAPLTERELEALRRQAAQVMPPYAEKFAKMLKVEYHRISIRTQKSVWGSCSGKKNLNFNCLLMLAPPEVQEYVAAHEVCHLLEMNHSEKFYALLTKVLPDWPQRRAWLKTNGGALLRRVYQDK